ncbi:MAG: bifunctional phosphopantothenoylcysteine decarboxylase/phosphopantothenate--cysteine ligase CoaBC [Candidatus Eisenbacteria bacterium]|nr:bifunctional phosphopantothenoylcysteine decarboxylase/phosphopantothenate--cysteine ligase CoaBC [Candidatus Eisenbacteria bacterium]
MFSGKKIVLGITGSIAAYKGVELLRALTKEGAQVRVVMTRSATQFLTPLTFEVLSGEKVTTTLFEGEASHGESYFPKGTVSQSRIKHIDLASWADCILVAPATANILGKVRSGIADDALSTVILASKARVIFAPAMNVNMLDNHFVQQNISMLMKAGYVFVEPEEGLLACGVSDRGRLASIDKIVDVVRETLFPERALIGKKIIVTAGRTEEPIDPVRHISNPSSGKMGYALAERGTAWGGKVVLISGPASLEHPRVDKFIKVKTAREMRKETLRESSDANVVIMASAVSDLRPVKAVTKKIRRAGSKFTLELEPTEDIIRELGEKKGKRVLVGFAVEFEDEIKNGKKKLKEKNLDLIVINNPGTPGAGFEVDTNVVTLVDSGNKVTSLPLMSKLELADKILEAVAGVIKKKVRSQS